MGDFANHDGDPNMILDCQEAPNPPGCYLVARREVAAGEELTFKYNEEDWSDLTFLANFGFAPLDNAYALRRQVLPGVHGQAIRHALTNLGCTQNLIDGGLV